MAQEHGRNNGVESETLPRMLPLVQRMNEARTAAKKLGLISEDQ